MSALLMPGIPFSILVVANVALAGWTFYYARHQQLTTRLKFVKEDVLALGLSYCGFAIFLGFMIAFDSFESTPGLDTLVGLAGALKFGMTLIMAGQVVVLIVVAALRKQLFTQLHPS